MALYLLAPLRLAAQQPDNTRTPAMSALSGFNASVTLAGAHDSYVGWYNVVTPALSYAFSPRYSADLSMSVYPYRLAPQSTGQFHFVGGDLGDMLLEAHPTFAPAAYRDIATASMTMPTGSRSDGLGTCRATFSSQPASRAEPTPTSTSATTTVSN